MRIVPWRASLRGRLIALLLLGAVPVAVLAADVAWQSFRAAASHARENTLLLEQSASARHRAAIEEVGQVLAAIARAPGLLTDRAGCERLVRDGLLLRSGRYAALGVLDQNGRPLCDALAQDVRGAEALVDAAPGREWFRTVRDTRRFTVSARRPVGADDAILIDAAYPLLAGDRFLGAAVATLRVDWFGGMAGSGADVWLIRPDGGLIPASGASAPALPPAADVNRLLSSSTGYLAASARPGRTYSYADAELGGGLRLLVVRDTSAEAAAARAVLFHRLLGLGVLLMLALAAVAFGANLALVEPLKRLTGTIERWRGGGPFDPGKLDALPAELKGLCVAFAHATGALTGRERQLRAALQKQELLAQEIHHRVKNNLQIVASLLNLQAARIRQPEARAEFQAARDRVRALGMLHRHLYLEGELQTIGMRGFLGELCGQLIEALGPAAGKRIGLDLEASELRMSSEQAVPLALIVTETVSNAVKYAFPGERTGNISVRLTAEGEQARLVIQDDGIGLPAGRGEAEADCRGGIGIQLVRGLARQLGATLTVSETQGTRYELIIPTSPPDPAETNAPGHVEASG